MHGFSQNIFPETELLLFAASWAQLVREVIYPSVQEGKIVLCDRFLDSTTVIRLPDKSRMILLRKLMNLLWVMLFQI